MSEQAPAGWSRERWRWAYRPRAGGPVTAFFHIQRVLDLPWDELRDLSAERTGGVPIPDEARPTDDERIAHLAEHPI